MKIRSKKIIYLSVISLAGIIILMGFAFIFIPRYLENEITESISLNNGKAKVIKVDLLSRSLKVTDFEWNSAYDSSHKTQHIIKATSISLNRLSLFQLIAKKSIQFKELIIDSGYLEFDKN